MPAEPHKVTLVLEGDSVDVKLICPEGGCETASRCAICGRAFDDQETGRCYDCPEPGAQAECWVKSWFDNVRGEEMYGGAELDLAGRTLPVPIECEWDGDCMRWRVVDETASAATWTWGQEVDDA